MPPEGFDLPLLAARFGRAVREAGIPCSPERSVRFARALEIAPPGGRDRLYWTARTVFVSSHAQVPAFDGVFARVFDGLVDPADTRGDQDAPPPAGSERGDRPPPPGAPLSSASEAGGSPRASSSPAAAPDHDLPAQELAVPAASADERLASKDFADLEPDELSALRRLMTQLKVATPLRRTRRARRARRGEHLDVRATLRASHRTGGDPVRRLRRRRVLRHRPLVVLCDVSGSMEPYSRAFLMFLHSAVGGADAEAFVFATRLTRLTRALRGHQTELAIARAAAAAPDWSGGTRIGAALQRFDDDYGRRGLARGAVVVIVSDGWEVGDPERVGREMARLGRLAHRIVWVNPRLAAPGFEPTAGGMAAALPYCDALVGGHNLLALGDAIAAIGARDTTTPS
ncbi:MAG TPA: VWA domain-containing protein [Baekduia sp.]|nr:VWA domain-containing protein [Baekduia sp.]